MLEHWREEPPVDVLVAAWLDYKPPPKPGERRKLELVARHAPRGLEHLQTAFPDGRAGQTAQPVTTVPEMPARRWKPGQ